MKICFYISFLLFGSFNCFSQTNKIADELIENNQLSLLSSVVNNAPLPNGSLNIAQVNQIGVNNDASVFVKAKKSNVFIDQRGSNNTIDVSYNVNDVSANLLQNGSNNSIIEIVNNTFGSVNSNVSQVGNNLEVNKIGSNSISNGLEVNMLGSNKTITIISF
ncbi:hypothetical protein ULMS_12350 [Patiriisocius marinistellae]|uniref:Curlin associated repeat-containing protein n=1 Tax=Patiriisocius marinistellae TaxID=2494560 RepID=A0A5J4FTD9_9FLAO|nr:hypothetical protein [Patiriisocius marinistellae]GEQ85727.1 hypothetical protein ULMS_12350 [Patiriisocius marinistellae]